MLKLLSRHSFKLPATLCLLAIAAISLSPTGAHGQPPVLSVSVGTGWNAISLPYPPADSDPYAVFDELRPPTQNFDLLSGNLHRYSNSASAYVAYQRSSPSQFGALGSGAGYLLWTPIATTVRYECYLPTSVPSAALSGRGWHIIGLPRLGSFSLGDVCVTNSDTGTSKLLADAVAAGWLQSLIYRIDRADTEGRGMTYVTLPAAGQDYATSSLNAYAAYWVHQSAANSILTFDRPPANFAAVSTSPDQVRLTWTDATAYDTGYQVERRTAGTDFELIATLPQDATLCTDRNVSPDTTYEYRVRGLNSVAFTAYTPVVAVTTPESDGSTPLGYVTAVGVDASRPGYAYGASREAGLIVFDVSEPAAPRAVGIASPPTTGVVMGMSVAGDLVAVAARDAVSLYDVATPTAPVRLAAIATASQDVQIVDNHLYVSDAYSDLAAYDISDPADPEFVATAPVTGYQMDLVGGNLWIGALTELRGVSIEPRWSPSLLGAYATMPCQIVSGDGDHVYLYSNAALQAIDISDPQDPFDVGFVTIQGGTLSALVGLGQYVYATFRSSLLSNSLYVFDVSDPNQPTLVGGTRTEGAPTGVVALEISAQDRRAYVADGIGGFSVIDVTNPSQPRLVGNVQTM